VGAFVLSFTGVATSDASGAGTGGRVGADEGRFGIAGAACAPGTLENEKKSFPAGKAGGPDNGELFAPCRKYALVPGIAGGFAAVYADARNGVTSANEFGIAPSSASLNDGTGTGKAGTSEIDGVPGTTGNENSSAAEGKDGVAVCDVAVSGSKKYRGAPDAAFSGRIVAGGETAPDPGTLGATGGVGTCAAVGVGG